MSFARRLLLKVLKLADPVLLSIARILGFLVRINGFFIPLWSIGLMFWGIMFWLRADTMSVFGFTEPILFRLYGFFLGLMGLLVLVSFLSGKMDLERLRWWLRLRILVLGPVVSFVGGIHNVSESKEDFLLRITMVVDKIYSPSFEMASRHDHMFLPDLDSTSEQLALAIVAVFVSLVKFFGYLVLEHSFWFALVYTMLPFAVGAGSASYMAVQGLIGSEIVEQVLRAKAASGVLVAKSYPFSNNFPLPELYRQQLKGGLINIPLDPCLEEFLHARARNSAAAWAKALPTGARGSLASLLNIYDSSAVLFPKSPLLHSRDPADFVLLETIVEYNRQILNRIAFVVGGQPITVDAPHVGKRVAFFKGDSARTLDSLYNYIQQQRDSISETLIAEFDALLNGYRGDIPMQRPLPGLHTDYNLNYYGKDVKMIWVISLRDVDDLTFRVLVKAGFPLQLAAHLHGESSIFEPLAVRDSLQLVLKKLSTVDEIVVPVSLPRHISLLETNKNLAAIGANIQNIVGSDYKVFKTTVVDKKQIVVEIVDIKQD